MAAVSLSKDDRKFLSGRFHAFLAAHPPMQFSRHLRGIFFDYLSAQVDNGFPVDFDDYLWELSELFDLLDQAAVFYPEEK